MYKLLPLLCLFLLSPLLHAQEKYFQKEKLQKDIQQLKKTLIAIHPGLGYFTPKEVVEQMLDQRAESLPDSMTRMAFFDLLAPVIDTIKCGHTNIKFAHKLFKEKEDKDKPQLFPLELVMIDNDVFLKKSFDIGTEKIPKGSEIIRIDSISIDQIVDRISKYHVGSDGGNKYPERLWAVRGFIGAYARFYGLKDKFVVDLVNSETNKPQTYTIDAVPPNAFDKIQKEKAKSYSPVTYKTIDSGKVGLLTMTSFSDKGLFQKSKGKLKKSFSQIREKKLDKLIIDLRDNGGGAIDNIKHLTRYLFEEEYLIIKKAVIEEDFKEEKKSFFQDVMFTFSKKELRGDEYIIKRFSKKNIKPRRNRFTGDLVVLINERSYSAAAMTPAIIKDKQRGTLIGAEAGGSYHLAFAGISKYVKLDNSSLRIRIPVIRLEYDITESAQDTERGVLPDIYKKYTKEDLINGTDTVLEYAIDFINNPKS